MRNIRKLRLLVVIQSSSCPQVLMVLMALAMTEAGLSSLQYTRRNLPGKAALFLPRMRNGRNSKVTEIPGSC